MALGDLGELNVRFTADLSGMIRGFTEAAAAMKAYQASMSGSAKKAESDTQSSLDKIKAGFSNLGTEISKGASDLKSRMGEIGNAAVQLGKNLLSSIPNAIDNLRNRFPLLDKAITTTETVFKRVGATIVGVWANITNVVGQGVNKLAGLARTIATPFQVAFDAVRSIIVAAANRIGAALSPIGAAFNALRSRLDPLRDAFSSVFSAIGGVIAGFARNAGNQIGQFVSRLGPFGQAIGQIFGGVGQAIANAAKQVGKFATTQASNAFKKLGESMSDIPIIGGPLGSMFTKLGGLIATQPIFIIPAVAAFLLLAAAFGTLGTMITLVMLEIVGATVIITAWVGAWLGVVFLGAAVVGSLAAIGVGMVALSAWATSASKSTDSVSAKLKDLEDSAKKVGKALGQEAAPGAKTFLGILQTLLPMAQSVAAPLIAGFNGLLAAAKPFLVTIGYQALQGISYLGQAFLQLGYAIAASPSALETLFGIFVQFSVSTLQGLFINLFKLSNWFTEELPTIGPIAGQIFSGIGSTVFNLITTIGKLAIWFSEHWPQIVTWTNQLWGAFNQLWGSVNSVIGPVIQLILQLFKMPETQQGLKLLAQIFGSVLFVAIMTVIVGVGLAIVAFLQFANQVGSAWNSIKQVWQAAPAWFGSLWSSISSHMISGAQTAVNGVIGVLRGFANAVNGSALAALGVHVGLVPYVNFGGGGGYSGSSGAGGGSSRALAFGTGGLVPGLGGADSVPARLTPGEAVLNRGAVRGLGGGPAISALNSANGLGAAGLGAISGNPYPWGQCTYYVYSRFPGMPIDGNAVDWINLPLAHASGPAPGEIVVYGLSYSPYGHVAVVESGLHGSTFEVSEMNYLGLGITDTRQSTMAGVLGFLRPGVAGVGGAGGIDLDPSAIMGGIISGIGLGGVVPWLRPLATSIMNTAGKGAVNAAQGGLSTLASTAARIASAATGIGAEGRGQGGAPYLPPSMTMNFNVSNAPSASRGHGGGSTLPGGGAARAGGMDETNQLLRDIKQLLLGNGTQIAPGASARRRTAG